MGASRSCSRELSCVGASSSSQRVVAFHFIEEGHVAGTARRVAVWRNDLRVAALPDVVHLRGLLLALPRIRLLPVVGSLVAVYLRRQVLLLHVGLVLARAIW